MGVVLFEFGVFLGEIIDLGSEFFFLGLETLLIALEVVAFLCKVVDLDVNLGQLYAVVGVVGSGKTSLLLGIPSNVLAYLHPPPGPGTGK